MRGSATQVRESLLLPASAFANSSADLVHFSFLTQDPSDPEFDGVICRELVAANNAAPGGIPDIGKSYCEKSVVQTDFTRHLTGTPNKVGTIDQTDHFFRLRVYTTESMCLKDFSPNDLAIDYIVKDGGQWGHFATKTFAMKCYLSPEQAQKDSHIAKEGQKQSAATSILPGHIAWIAAAAFFAYSLS